MEYKHCVLCHFVFYMHDNNRRLAQTIWRKKIVGCVRWRALISRFLVFSRLRNTQTIKPTSPWTAVYSPSESARYSWFGHCFWSTGSSTAWSTNLSAAPIGYDAFNSEPLSVWLSATLSAAMRPCSQFKHSIAFEPKLDDITSWNLAVSDRRSTILSSDVCQIQSHDVTFSCIMNLSSIIENNPSNLIALFIESASVAWLSSMRGDVWSHWNENVS